jgi:5'-3' exonuclease
MYRTVIADAPYLTRRVWEAAENKLPALAGSVLSFILSLYKRFDPPTIAFVWEADGGSGEMRKSQLSTYKGKRKPPPAEYLDAISELQLILPVMGVTQVVCAGEADDAANSITLQWPGPWLLWSADKDWLQMVRPNVDLLRPNTDRRPANIPRDEWRRPPDQLITAANIVELTGLDPQGWFEVLSLAGDPVDGIPGLPKVGPKRARDLHRACPGIVGAIERGNHETVLETVLETDPDLLRWARLAIDRRDDLLLSAGLVELADLPLTETPPAEISDLSVAVLLEWCERFGLENQGHQLADLLSARVPNPNDSIPF